MADPMIDTGATDGVADQASSTDTSKAQLPGYTGQFDKEAMKDLQARLSKDKGFAEKLPKGLSDLYRQYAASLDLADRVMLPGKDDPKEVWDRYYKAIGRPDSPDGYVLKKPDLPKGVGYSETLEKGFRSWMFANGISQQNAEKIFADYNKIVVDNHNAAMKAQIETLQKQASNANAVLAKDYGEKFPENMQFMQKALGKFMTEGAMAKIKSAKLPSGITLDNDPDFIKGWVEIGKAMSDEKLIVTTEAGETGPRKGLPTTGHGHTLQFPKMRDNPMFRVKDQ
jgi:hypothetical protein